MTIQSELKAAGEEALKKLNQPTVDHPDTQRTVEVPTPTMAAEFQASEKAQVREPSAAEAEDIRAQKKFRMAQVLTRGVLNAKLESVYNASVPTGCAGKFIRDDFESIIRYKNLGYTFEYSEGANKLYGTPEGHIRVGDVVLMTISTEDLEILREVRAEATRKRLGAARKEYVQQTEAQEGMRPIDESISNVN